MKVPDKGHYVVFTAYKRQKLSSSEIEDDPTAANAIKDINYPTIFFHEIEENAIRWEIFGGELFIDAKPNENPKKPFDVYYLCNEMYNDTDLMGEYDNMTQEEIQDLKYHESDYQVNVIKFGVHPKNLDDRKIKAPLVKTIK